MCHVLIPSCHCHWRIHPDRLVDFLPNGNEKAVEKNRTSDSESFSDSASSGLMGISNQFYSEHPRTPQALQW
jgi:hypothetical protein